ncbi:MAG: L-threonylcarbamoyladenylate synthase [Proteobacteria bacterium]|nr:L-threonylcarbamoyladenylate synthase [Pseudomonadota bacterium]
MSAAGDVLRAGGLLVYPTETVYGIGVALSADVDAVRRAKRSPPGRPYLVVAADAAMACSLWTQAPPPELAKHWPGPLTLIGPAREGLPPELLGAVGDVPTIAVRVPGDPWLRALIQEVGEPIVSTSANVAGAPAPQSFDEVDVDALAPDLAIDRGACPGGVASTLVDFVAVPWKILRPGPITPERGSP